MTVEEQEQIRATWRQHDAEIEASFAKRQRTVRRNFIWISICVTVQVLLLLFQVWMHHHPVYTVCLTGTRA